jgi:hypothetical protein
MIGIGAVTVTLFARGLQDWDQSREPLIAPFRAEIACVAPFGLTIRG